jgi:hypothetical protein
LSVPFLILASLLSVLFSSFGQKKKRNRQYTGQKKKRNR